MFLQLLTDPCLSLKDGDSIPVSFLICSAYADSHFETLRYVRKGKKTVGKDTCSVYAHSGLLEAEFVCLLVGCLTSQQHASVSQGRVCSDNFTCCHTEVEVADQTFHLTQSQNTDTGPTSTSTDPITPAAWQGSHWSANFQVTGMTRPRKNPSASGIRTRDLPLSRRTP